jgi:CBS domain-containing protein
MSATRLEGFISEFRRIRENISGARHEEPRRKRSEPGLSPSHEQRHVVPSRLAIVDVMEGNLATVLPESPLRPALALMIENQISSVPVVDSDGRIAGALNEGDLMRVFFEPDTRCVAEVMTREPLTAPIDAPLVDVIDQLMSSNFRRVLIHEDHRLVGVITRSHVMPALLSALDDQVALRDRASEPH